MSITGITSASPAVRRDGWLIKHSESHTDFGNIKGVRYQFGRSLPNGTTGLQVGDLVIGFLAASDVQKSEGRMFGIGRIGQRRGVGDGNREEVYFDRFLTFKEPLNWDDFGGDPRNNQTNSIVRAPAEFISSVMSAAGLSSIGEAPVPEMIRSIGATEFEKVLFVAGVYPPASGDMETDELLSLDVLDLQAVEAWMGGLTFDGAAVVEQALAALRSGKHLLLQGAPGTGKTSLAAAIGQAALASGVIRGVTQITGSSDWTPSDTVGTYRLNREKDLEFVKGHILKAIVDDHWVVLDELNRADIDRAMGPLFSVLSGQATTLRYEEDSGDGEFAPVAIVPHGERLDGCVNYEVSPNWRIIATMNTKDLDLLFEVSQAFLRRFAVLTIPCPSRAAHRVLLAAHATGQIAVDEMVCRLVSLPDAEIGPAITLDCARYVAERVALQPAPPDMPTLADEVFAQFIQPQLSGMDGTRRRAVLAYLRFDDTSSLASATPPDDSEADDVTVE